MTAGHAVKLNPRRLRVGSSGGKGARRVFGIMAPEETPAGLEPWWRPLMDDDAHRAITLEIERTKGSLSAHERECVIRYEGIHSTMTEMKTSIDTLLTRERVHEQHLSKLQIATLVAVIAIGIAVIGWMSVQIYQLQPARVAAEARR